MSGCRLGRRGQGNIRCNIGLHRLGVRKNSFSGGVQNKSKKLVFVCKADFAFLRMYVDVKVSGLHVHVYQKSRMPVFRAGILVGLVNGLLNRLTINGAAVDKYVLHIPHVN